MNDIGTSSGLKKKAIQAIVLFGLVSLFGDMVYEAGRSVHGPYLKTLGANAAVVGLVAGIAELFGYTIRLASGYYADRTRSYWLFTFIGYALIASVPMLSLTGFWQAAVMLIVLERIGKALRSPAKDTILSQAARQVGTGFGFGLHELFDQIGAIAGPLVFTILFLIIGAKENSAGDYRHGYGLLWLPFIAMIICVIFAYLRLPHPEEIEPVSKTALPADKLSPVFRLYTLFSFITTLGFANFALIGYHFKAKNVLTDAQIPLFYALAMLVDGVAAIIIGKSYDRLKAARRNEYAGIALLVVLPLLSALIPVFAFTSSAAFALTAAIIWGLVMGVHETIMKSAVADLTSLSKRGTGYGVFNCAYGIAMFIGAAFMGLIYEKSLTLLVAFCVAAQVFSIPVFLLLQRTASKASR